MEQENHIDALVRRRIRALRLAQGWSLETLAKYSFLSPSNLSRIETGSRRIALDQLVAIAHALNTSLDQLIESDEEKDVIIRPHVEESRGMTIWPFSSEENSSGHTVAKIRIASPVPTLEDAVVHPGHDWFMVLSGTAELRLGEKLILVETGHAAEFSTMTPHAIGAYGNSPVEILTIFSAESRRAHTR